MYTLIALSFLLFFFLFLYAKVHSPCYRPSHCRHSRHYICRFQEQHKRLASENPTIATEVEPGQPLLPPPPPQEEGFTFENTGTCKEHIIRIRIRFIPRNGPALDAYPFANPAEDLGSLSEAQLQISMQAIFAKGENNFEKLRFAPCHIQDITVLSGHMCLIRLFETGIGLHPAVDVRQFNCCSSQLKSAG